VYMVKISLNLHLECGPVGVWNVEIAIVVGSPSNTSLSELFQP
jgi:hypothetical protein